MLSNREAISEVINDLNALTIDEYVSKRYVHTKLKMFAALLIKRDSDSRKLFKQIELFTNFKKIPMIEKPTEEVCGFTIPNCDTLMVSKNKIKGLIATAYGPIGKVTNMNGSVQYIQIPESTYQSMKDSRFGIYGKYFWFSDGHLVVPGMVAAVKGSFLTDDPSANKDSNENADGGCNSVLDSSFICPDYLYEAVRQETVKDLFGFYKRVQPDENPDGSVLKKAATPQ